MLQCDQEYIGESARTFEERLKEHLREPFPIYEHANKLGHLTSVDKFSILGGKSHSFTRDIKETMYIRVNDPSLNCNLRKYQLSNEVLFNVPNFLLK